MKNGTKPMYQQISDDLKRQIATGELAVGAKLPTEMELTKVYQVSRITTKRAVEILAEDGLIIRRPGRGSFVLGEPQKHERKQTAMFGAVVAGIAAPFGQCLIETLSEEVWEREGSLLLLQSHGKPDLEAEAILKLKQLDVDGLLIWPSAGEYLGAEILQLIVDRYPFVLIDRQVKGMETKSVGTNNVKMTKEALAYLFSQGHRDIGFVSMEPSFNSSVEERLEGFIESHADQGIAIQREAWLVDAKTDLLHEQLVDLLQRNPTLTALFVTEYELAVRVWESLQSLGYRVPTDISLICFDSPEELAGGVCFTHVKQDEVAIAKEAVALLKRAIAGDAKPERVLLDGELVLGDTVAAREQ
ncbi:GntR family transcriptional regulator [Listeria booriae]|uniref:GntR family transcriptional regulator n=1 Tax=Listeria booriae TaxID=1552123 RepID=UPI001623BCB7|nr:GntR family transcriptional regulator [Listeria booriae]MBC1802075.1 GntR family transcriptional regulator [Listeria booriae]